jgi:crossover junction endodeoxyribonuclease RuvC
MIRILGIDPGLAHTGWGLIEGQSNRLYHIKHGSVSTKAHTEHAERLLTIYTEIQSLIKEFSPSFVAVEALYFAKNRSSGIPVAEARGVILLAAAASLLPARSFTPLEIKQALTGSGRASKQQVQEMVKLMLGLTAVPTPDHAADALAAAICGYHNYQFDRSADRGRG